jgi:hypothetical protein
MPDRRMRGVSRSACGAPEADPMERIRNAGGRLSPVTGDLTEDDVPHSLEYAEADLPR